MHDGLVLHGHHTRVTSLHLAHLDVAFRNIFPWRIRGQKHCSFTAGSLLDSSFGVGHISRNALGGDGTSLGVVTAFLCGGGGVRGARDLDEDLF